MTDADLIFDHSRRTVPCVRALLECGFAVERCEAALAGDDGPRSIRCRALLLLGGGGPAVKIRRACHHRSLSLTHRCLYRTA